MDSRRKLKGNKPLSVSQKQAIIKLIEKPSKDKGLIQNQRPISLLNVDQKVMSKARAARLKKVLPFLISPGQQRAIMVGLLVRVIYPADILETTNLENTGLLFFFFFNWDSPHARLNSHYEAWSYKKKNKKDYRIQKICLERTYS